MIKHQVVQVVIIDQTMIKHKIVQVVIIDQTMIKHRVVYQEETVVVTTLVHCQIKMR